MTTAIELRKTIIGKRYLTDANLSRIVAKDDEGNEWRIKKERNGYIFRHIRDNTGISGFSDSIETLVLNALTRVSGVNVYVEDARP